jgi:hypothetical protein
MNALERGFTVVHQLIAIVAPIRTDSVLSRGRRYYLR